MQRSQVRKCLLKSEMRVYIQRNITWSYSEKWIKNMRGWSRSRIKRGGALQVKKVLNILALRALCQNEWKFQVWYVRGSRSYQLIPGVINDLQQIIRDIFTWGENTTKDQMSKLETRPHLGYSIPEPQSPVWTANHLTLHFEHRNQGRSWTLRAASPHLEMQWTP